MTTNAELIAAINAFPFWIPELCEELCARAGLEDEWEAACGEDFEPILFEAAEKLGLELR